MNEKAKITLAVIKKELDKFPEKIIDKANWQNKINCEECCKESIYVDKVFFNISNNCSLFLVLCFAFL